MRAVCNTEELGRKLGVVSRGVATRSVTGVLSGVLVEADSGEGIIRLSSTNNEISISATSSAQVEQDGSVVVPARIFSDIVRSLPAGDITLERDTSEGAVRISSNSNDYRIRSYEASDFPSLPQMDPEKASVISGEILVETVEKVSRSYSRDETRIALTGILMSFEGERVRMVTTDSYRLSVAEVELGLDLSEGEAIIPARYMSEVGRIFSASEAENIEFQLTDSHALFRVEDVLFACRLIDANFPDYKRIIPEDYEREISVSREELLGTLRRVSLFSGRQSSAVPVSLSFSEGGLEVIVNSPEIGEARESLPSTSDDEFYVSFNPGYLIDGVSSVDTDKVIFRFNEPMKPGLIVPEGEDGEFLYLIMPMRHPSQG